MTDHPDDTPAKIIQDLAKLAGTGEAAYPHIRELSWRARAMVHRWDRLAASQPMPAGGDCFACGAAADDECHWYGPESDACARNA